MIKIRLRSAILASGLIAGGVAIAQAPKQNVSKGLHPHLAAAQRQSLAAYNSIVAAQEANEWDLAGHAQKAKNLLDQVNSELKLAAQQSNKNKGK